MPGPLGLSLLALFGPGFFPKTAQAIRTAEDAVSRTLCRTVPFHIQGYKDSLSQVDRIHQDGDIHPYVCSDAQWARNPVTGKSTGKREWYMRENWQDQYLFEFVGSLGRDWSAGSVGGSQPSPKFGGRDASSWPSMAMHYANQAWLDIASSSWVYNETAESRDNRFVYSAAIWNIPGLEYNKPSVSTAGVVVVSVLLGFQVLGLLFLLW